MTRESLAAAPHVRALVAAAAAVSAAGLVAECAYHWLWPAMPESLYAMFSLSFESNVPTWYASTLLAAAAVGLAVIASRPTVVRRRQWWVLAAGFAFMSLDEAVELHEQLGGLVGTGGVLYFDWIVVAGPVVLLLGLSFVPFLRDLDPPTRRRFVVAGAMYVGGALVMELPLGWWTERAGPDNLGYGLIDWVEESLELAGATLFVASVFAVSPVYDSE